MSILASFYNKTAMHLRDATTSPTVGDTVTTVSASVRGLLRPVTNAEQLYNGNNWGKEFDWVCDDSETIKSGDRLVVDGVSYAVQAVSNLFDYEGSVDSHLDCRVVRRPN